jgi:hypothetical protein
MFKNPFTICLLLLLAAGCASKKKASDVMMMVKETGQLVTAEYTLSKIIKANDNKTWYKVGDRKILMSCEAVVKAGVNLEALTEQSFYVEDDSVSMILPPAQFFSLAIPPDKIKVQYQEVDLLRDPFSAAEREGLLAQAEEQIRGTVDSLGILQTAQANAALYLEHLLGAAGFSKVHIRFQRSNLTP